VCREASMCASVVCSRLVNVTKRSFERRYGRGLDLPANGYFFSLWYVAQSRVTRRGER
jgi:hypothetical protein